MKKFIAIAIIALFNLNVEAKINIKEFTTPKENIKVWFVEDHSLPIISLKFQIDGGGVYDEEGQDGKARLCVSLLDEGAGPYESDAFHKKIESLAIKLNFQSGNETIKGAIETLSANKDEAFNLFRLALHEARIDDEPFNRAVSQTLVGIKQQEADPYAQATKAAMKALFPDHPYSRQQIGTKESISNLKRDDCKKFIQHRLSRSNIMIGAVGDISKEELGTRIDRIFGALPKTIELPKIQDVEPKTDGQLHVTKMERPQTVALFIQKGLPRNHKDFYAAYILNHILGGGTFTTRLLEEVRVKRGLTYYTGSRLQWFRHSNMLMGSVSTDNKRFNESYTVIKDVWKKLAEEGPTNKEIEDAKLYINGSFPLKFDNMGSIADFLLTIQEDKLGIDYMDKRMEYINAVTAADVKRVAKEFLDVNNLTFFAAGDPQQPME
jgi:zinc protease